MHKVVGPDPVVSRWGAWSHPSAMARIFAALEASASSETHTEQSKTVVMPEVTICASVAA